jgi:hypothetical protein
VQSPCRHSKYSIISNKTRGNDGFKCIFEGKKKTHGSVAVLRLMFLYLIPSLASKAGKTNIGDEFLLTTGKFPLGSIPAFICLFSPLSHEFSINNFYYGKGN